MALQIEHSFNVEAPIAQVWDYFREPPQVVPCLPGAELLEIIDEQTYLGALGLRVGQITAQFKGTAQITEVSDEAYTMTINASGDQQGTTGRADADIHFELFQVSPATTEVKITADVSISGKLAQLGGSMIQSVSKFMFGRFAKCVSKAIESTE